TMSFLSRMFGPRKVLVQAKTLGILDLSGGTASQLAAADRSVLESRFNEVKVSTREVPRCQLLLLCCTLAGDGTVPNTDVVLRELILDAAALDVIVATPNSVASYTAAGKPRSYGMANLMMTLDRKNDAFGLFVQRLVDDMKRGTPMPVAWNKLAPQ